MRRRPAARATRSTASSPERSAGLPSVSSTGCFLSATPHNGHSNSFSSLLEILDPQRFTRGVPVRPRELDAVMVRRLKSDLRYFGEKFPERVVDPIRIDGLPNDAPELVLSRKLAAYGEVIRARTANLRRGRPAMCGSRSSACSSACSPRSPLSRRPWRCIARALRADAAASEAAAEAFVHGGAETEDEPSDETAAEKLIEDEEDQAAEAAGALAASAANLALVDEMLEIARKHAHRPDARIRRLAAWIRATWRRAAAGTSAGWSSSPNTKTRGAGSKSGSPKRSTICSPTTGSRPSPARRRLERREELKRRFNADPAEDPLRILICTDAAREGINLQMRCHDLIHIDLPWNPARLEQRNGRIDRKLQPSPKVWCRYFVYEQRAEDVVLQALVRKTERIRDAARLCRTGDRPPAVGSARTGRHLAGDSPWRAKSTRLATSGLQRPPSPRWTTRPRRGGRVRRRKSTSCASSCEDRARRSASIRRCWKRSSPTALARAGTSLDAARAGEISGIPLFRLDPNDPAFAGGGWAEALDDLRDSPPQAFREAEGLARDCAAARCLVPPGTDRRRVDAEGVLQLHLEHRLVRRLLSRFLEPGLLVRPVARLRRLGPGAQPRVVLLGRLALYGPGAARLHEEILLVTAAWTESRRGTKPLKPFGAVREAATLDQLDQALRNPRSPAAHVIERIRPWAAQDATDLEPELQRRAEARKADGHQAIWPQSATPRRNPSSAFSKTSAHASPRPTPSPRICSFLLLDDAEAEQRRRDRRRWKAKLEKLAKDIAAGAGARAGGLFRRRRPAGDDRPCLSLAGEQLIMAGIDPNDEWLGHVQPVGLVVAPIVLARHGLNPRSRRAPTPKRCARSSAGRDDARGLALARPLGFLHADPRLAGGAGRRRARRAGTAGGLVLKVEESDTEICAALGGRRPGRRLANPRPHRGAGRRSPNERGALEGWEATPHQRFERLLRENQRPDRPPDRPTTNCGSSTRRAARRAAG